MVFISTARCVGNTAEGFDEAVRGMKTALKERAEAEGHAFYAIGATAQWSVEEGLDYLMRGESPVFHTQDFGPWDEVWAGRNWLNTAGIDFIWRGTEGPPVVPQVVVIERTVETADSGLTIGPDRLLARAEGGDGVVEWFEAGMPFKP